MTCKIEILYEKDGIVVINKPAGLLVHPDSSTSEETLIDWIKEKYPESSNIGESMLLRDGKKIERPGIVHRLDKDTSGALLLAISEEAFEHLKSLFKNREIEKTYYALVYGSLKKKQGKIDRPIGKNAKDFRLWSAQRGAKGKLREAVTEYSVLKSGEEASFLKIKPYTGRTHQIRVHMKAINHPIVADPLYAPKYESILGFKRMALHAYGLSFKELRGNDVHIEAPFPEDFFKVISYFQLQEDLKVERPNT